MTQEIEKNDHNNIILDNLILLISVMFITWGILRCIDLPVVFQNTIYNYYLPQKFLLPTNGGMFDIMEGTKLDTAPMFIKCLADLLGIVMVYSGIVLLKRKYYAVNITVFVLIAAISVKIIGVILSFQRYIVFSEIFLMLLINLFFNFIIYQILQKIKKDDSLINSSENGVQND